MKFGFLDSEAKACSIVEADNLRDLYPKIIPAHLDPQPGSASHVDHGMMRATTGFVVYEYGMFTPKEKQNYSSLFTRFIAGNALFYECDEMGETIDFTSREMFQRVIFYKDWRQAAEAMNRGELHRPEISVNGEVFWQWPAPKPDLRKIF